MVIPEPAGVQAEEDRSRRPAVFSAVREVVAAMAGRDPHLGLYGAFGYDLAFQFEPVRLRGQRPGEQRDLVLHLPDEIYVLDRKRETAVRYRYDFEVAGASTRGLPRRTPPTPPAGPPEPVPPGPEPGSVSFARVGRGGQGAFCQRRPVRGGPQPRLPRAVHFPRLLLPSGACGGATRLPYEFFFNLGEGECLVGASPEMYVRVTGDRVETCPISGTIRRGTDPLEDAANIRALLNSAKEESELTMCTDVDRNDKSRVCVPGSVRVIGRRQIEMYSRLIHTVHHIEGPLRPGLDALDAFLTHMWAVTVTGAPKTWAMQFIEDHEPRRAAGTAGRSAGSASTAA